MADPQNNTGAPGTPPALPSADDVARNERERQQAVAEKARRLVQQHVEHGRVLQPGDFRGFGKDGYEYFSRLLRAATRRQIQDADQSRPPNMSNAPVGKPGSVLVETAQWHALEHPRRHYAAGPRTWGFWAAVGVGVLSFGLAELGLTAVASETLASLFYLLILITNGF